MTDHASPGQRFRQALGAAQPLQIVGVVNAYCALMAKRLNYRAIYLSGSVCAACSYGLPDLAITNLSDVLTDVRRITAVCDLPILVDIDTGWGSTLNIQRTIQAMIQAGAAAVHIEDQPFTKRCGHLAGKSVISSDEMVNRVRAAVAAKRSLDQDFFIIARTDAVAVEGIDAAIERAQAYLAAGADGIFVEALSTLSDYERFTAVVPGPVLANITEFGQTPLFTRQALQSAGVAMALYPWAVGRAMNQAAWSVMQILQETGTQQSYLDHMQDRQTLYDILNYDRYAEADLS